MDSRQIVYPDDQQSFDRRVSPRINWVDSEVQVIIISSHSHSEVSGWLQDISQGGVKVKTEIPQKFRGLLKRWEEIHFETFEDFFQLKGQGRVVWTSSTEDMVGIRFDQLDEESRISLNGFLGMWF